MLKNQSKRSKKINFSFVNTYCLLFTVTTIISSLIQIILLKQVYDTNSHILNRSIVVAIGTSSIYLLLSIKLKNKILEVLTPYAISLSLVLLYVFCTGFLKNYILMHIEI